MSPPPPALLAPSCEPSHQAGCPGEFLPVPGKNNWGREKGPQSPWAPALPRAWGSPARGRKPCGFWLLPGGLRIWPPPPPPPPPSGQQPKYYSAGGVGGGGRRPGLKEAFRVAKPGASCPQARASGCPTGDLRWPERRGVVVGSLGEGGAICRGFWWPPARLASPGVGRCDPPPHPRDSRLVSNVEKYHHQTWDVWTDRRMR